MRSLKNKIAIVTGASRGLGKSIAWLLAHYGATVVVNYATRKEDADQVVSEIIATGGVATAIQADIRNSAGITELFDKTLETFGKIDIVINNAGIFIAKPLQETTEDDFDQHFNLNVKSVFLSMKESASKMADNGRIINISSSVTRLMLPGYSTYSASKAAVEQLTRVFSKEIGHKGITVNSVSPGPLNTELFLNGKSEEMVQKIASQSAFNRIGETMEVAPLILFLASEEASWITGQNFAANGGMA